MSQLSRYGVCAHRLHNEGLKLMAEAGIGWVRVDFDWPDIEPYQGERNWQEHDRIVVQCRELGLSILAVVGYTAPWASPHGDTHSPARDPGLFLDFLGACVQRYRGQDVAAWSVWNEPNLRQFWTGTRDQFTRDYWAPGLREVRDISPHSLIVGPDLSSAGNNRAVKDWLPACLDAAGDLLDVVTHHQYDGGDTVDGRVREIDKLHLWLVAHGHARKQLWITETGEDKLGDVDQARFLRGMMQAMQMRPWWGKTFWYDSHGPKWGLLDGGGKPRDAWHAYRDLTNLPPEVA